MSELCWQPQARSATGHGVPNLASELRPRETVARPRG